MNMSVIRTLAAVAAAAGLCVSVSVHAAPDIMWVNPGGGLSGLAVDGAPVVPLKPGARTPQQIVDGFDALCAKTDFDKLKVNPVIAGSGWGGAYMPSMMAMTSGEVDLGGWQGEDHSLGVAKDVFFSPNPQCVLTVSTATHYPAVELFPVLTARYGKPANSAEMFGADGKPNDTVKPYWLLPASAPTHERILFARSLSRGSEHRIHLALLERKKAS